MNNYEDMIELPRPISKKHQPMSLNNRSAQFAPFSALIGYDEKIRETARITDKKIELDEEGKVVINEKLLWLKKHIQLYPQVSITYFLRDQKKSGGKYQTITGQIKKIDELEKTIYLMDKKQIKIEDIINIVGIDFPYVFPLL